MGLEYGRARAGRPCSDIVIMSWRLGPLLRWAMTFLESFSLASVQNLWTPRSGAITTQRVWEAVALMFAGVFIAFLIAEYFVRPIRRLVGVTRKVAEGELDFSAPGKRK